MKTKSQRFTSINFSAVLGILAILTGLTASAQDEDRTRMLWNTQFSAKRPAKKSAAAPPAAPAAQQKTAEPGDIGDSLVGVTIWNLRQSRSQDDPLTRIAELGSQAQWTPVRIAADSVLSQGQRIRVSLEVARSGYLYVIDREQYADGSLGKPFLIFPTLRIHGGNNEVTAGRVIEIPAQADTPAYFTMKASRPDHVAEMLTVIVTPSPLDEVSIGREAIELAPEQVVNWEKQWGAKVSRLEAKGQEGKSYTQAEKEAGTERVRLLTHDEPLPQTMYHVEAQPGAPLLLSVPLRIAP
ncbi:MAG: hypothetical protein A3F68_10810 [Acidobacteria bacterium RIFCSPLOWO2_12_FULL_54_10]|nr:MAG: hypothetical protein A3F68_10810 [Acidobacteria bacterium RIFCSPLOWO2_12_FULL_54_10]